MSVSLAHFQPPCCCFPYLALSFPPSKGAYLPPSLSSLSLCTPTPSIRHPQSPPPSLCARVCVCVPLRPQPVCPLGLCSSATPTSFTPVCEYLPQAGQIFCRLLSTQTHTHTHTNDKCFTSSALVLD